MRCTMVISGRTSINKHFNLNFALRSQCDERIQIKSISLFQMRLIQMCMGFVVNPTKQKQIKHFCGPRTVESSDYFANRHVVCAVHFNSIVFVPFHCISLIVREPANVRRSLPDMQRRPVVHGNIKAGAPFLRFSNMRSN